MDVGEFRRVETGACEDLYLVEIGMYGVREYGCVYVLDADRPAIVETGMGTHHDAILDALDGIGLAKTDVAVIAVTHVHLDHAGGAGFLAEACPNATVAVHEIGAPHLVDPGRLIAGTKQAVEDQWRYYAAPTPVPAHRIREISDGDAIDLGDHTLEAAHVPGHAPHQVAFHDPANRAVFTGDAAGLWVPARKRAYPSSPPPNFDLEQAIADLDTLRALDPGTLLFTHFGPARYRAEILEDYGERLADWVREVEAAYAELRDVDRVVDRFVDRSDLDAVWGTEKVRAEMRLNVRGVLDYLERERE